VTEIKAPRKTGHWLRKDVPLSGWRCIGIEEGADICQMCELAEISHSHVMTHERLPGVEWRVGLVCASHMSGNAEQERLREVHYAWLAAVRANRTPIQKLKRKRWRGKHFTSGAHEWTMRVDRLWDQFIVKVRNEDGWRYTVQRHWWARKPSMHLHGGPFDSDVEAAVSGIAQAELLQANSGWMANDRAAEIMHLAAARAESEAHDIAILRAVTQATQAR
jgi:hypothetical protein